MGRVADVKKLIHEQETQRIPLTAAFLCLDCEDIHMASLCPGCGSRRFMPVTTAITPLLRKGEVEKFYKEKHSCKDDAKVDCFQLELVP